MFGVGQVVAFVRKHYIPEGGQNISAAMCDTNLRATPYMHILGDSKLSAKIFNEIFQWKFSMKAIWSLVPSLFAQFTWMVV